MKLPKQNTNSLASDDNQWLYGTGFVNALAGQQLSQ